MTQRFEKAYSALVNAYFNGTLVKGMCTACAVGNIVADAQGGVISVNNGIRCTTHSNFWGALFATHRDMQVNRISIYPQEADRLLSLTGYTAHELAEVEFAFETNTKIHVNMYEVVCEQFILQDQFNGLCAVVDVLLELDNITDNGHKSKFREHPKLVTV